ncbi:MAG: DUF1800 family protein [Methylococcales bacterium]|nr:DUF1800 family protein [Methylococcales bacterium]
MSKIAVYLSILFLVACNTSTPNKQRITGVVLDSAIEGLNYKCANDETGVTTAEGQFSCEQFPVQFFVGSLAISAELNSIATDGKMFLGDLLGLDRSNTSDDRVLNLAVLLQSLDDDNNPENGIQLTSVAKSNFTVEQHIDDMSSTDINTQLTAMGKTVVAVNDAQSHLISTLAANEASVSSTNNQTNADTLAPSGPILVLATTKNLVSIGLKGEIASKVFIGETETSTLDESGQTNIDLDTSGDNGNKIFNITLKDAAGNISRALNITIAKTTPDTTAPNLPTLSIPPSINSAGLVSFEITGEAGAKVFIGTLNVATLDEDGKATITINIADINNQLTSVDANGVKTLSITLKDAAGNRSTVLTINTDYKELLTKQEAIRFLNQTTFGHNKTDIDHLISIGTTQWMNDQLALASTYDLPLAQQESHINALIKTARALAPTKNPESFVYYTNPNNNFNSNAQFNMRGFRQDSWAERTMFASDQLRQRMAFALSQIIVVSENDAALSERADSLAYHYDILAKHAFGNYKDLLKEVALSPAMGMYLTHQGSQKASGVILPDENFAREIMQLFSIGLYKLNTDGSFIIEGGQPVPTYTQSDVEEMAKIWTGWELLDNHTPYITRFGYSTSGIGKYGMPMEFDATYHEAGAKTILGINIPAGQTGQQDVDSAIQILMNNPSMAPFVSRQLIQRLVTSNPTAAYISRVATVFNDDGTGVKGNLKAVLKAILLDDEAKKGSTDNAQFGKVKEPLLAILQFLKAFDVKKLDNAQFSIESLNASLGQEAMQASSVFNFYSPNYTPNDADFINNKFNAPELQVQTGFRLASVNNYIFNLMQRNERIKGIKQQGSLSAFENTLSSHSYKHNLTISIADELAVMKIALNDPNDGFAGLNQKTTRDAAINALLDHLEDKILTRKLTSAQQSTIVNYFDFYHADTEDAAWKIIRKTLRFIVPSHIYMIQD